MSTPQNPPIRAIIEHIFYIWDEPISLTLDSQPEVPTANPSCSSINRAILLVTPTQSRRPQHFPQDTICIQGVRVISSPDAGCEAAKPRN